MPRRAYPKADAAPTAASTSTTDRLRAREAKKGSKSKSKTEAARLHKSLQHHSQKAVEAEIAAHVKALTMLCDNDTLRSVIHDLIEHSRIIHRAACAQLSVQFTVGDKVSFKDRKGFTQLGTVTKMGPKNAVVEPLMKLASDRGWRVPYTMLTKED